METGGSSLSITIAGAAGITVTIVTNQVGHGGDLLSPAEYLAPRGLIYGAVVAIAVLVITRLFAASLKARSWGILFGAVVSGLFGLLMLNWNLMWGVPLASLEGAWLWPLAIVPLVLSFVLFRRWRRVRRPDEVADLSASEQDRSPGGHDYI